MISGPRIAFLLLFLFVLSITIASYLYPLPSVIFLAGPKESTFYTEAERYKDILNESGVVVEIIETTGTIENLKLLQKAETHTVAFADAVHELDAALTMDPGGTQGTRSQLASVSSLGAIYLNPLWIFVPKGSHLLNLEQLDREKHHILGAGWEGSSERMLASLILESIGMDENVQIARIGEADKPVTSTEAITALREQRFAGLLTIGRPDSPLVDMLLHSNELVPVPMARAQAYQIHFPFLKAVSLPEGGLDLRSNIPHQELQLLAASTELLVSGTLSPAIADLLLDATSTLHGAGSWFSSPNEFPNSQMASIPLHSSAVRYYESGPPLLQKILPFRWATLLDRISIFILGFGGIAIAVLSGAPGLIELYFIKKMEGAYREMESIEKSLSTGCDRAMAMAKLDELERTTSEYKLWLSNLLAPWMEMRQNLHDLRERVSNKED